jgi:ABC-type nitrate/sulfonate/bicarbonate transport system ATPase subunit
VIPTGCEDAPSMVTSVTIRRLKRFNEETFELGEAVVLAGPNNSGKTTLLQAVATWQLGLRHWLSRRSPGKTSARARAGVVLTRQQFTAMPLREMSLLWNERRTAGEEASSGRKRRIEIILRGDDDGGWECGVEFEYATPETIYVRPLGAREGSDIASFPPAAARRFSAVHIPPLSGIDHEEPRRDRAFQDVLVGQGRPGEVLRNLLLDVAGDQALWSLLQAHIGTLFDVELLAPEYGGGAPYIVCEYRSHPRARPLDIANAGSGFLQVLLLMAFFYAREGTILLLDEPDAHLHVILQKEVYDVIRHVASDRGSQLVIATHSEVLLDASSPEQVISFAKAPPTRLSSHVDRDRLRESLKRLTTTDLLLAAQVGAVLYLEDRSDEQILAQWAKTLGHPAATVLDRPYVHWLGGNSLAEAKAHFFAFQHVVEPVRGLVLLDGDNQDREDATTKSGLAVSRWRRYEIENYLLIPRAIAAAAAFGKKDDALQFASALSAVEAVFATEVPPGVDLFGNAAGLTLVKASTGLLPQALAAAGRPLVKRDFYLVAAEMSPEEIHPEVIEKLDLIASSLSPSMQSKEGT